MTIIDLINESDAARVLAVSPRQIKVLTDKGVLRARFRNGGLWFAPADLDALWAVLASSSPEALPALSPRDLLAPGEVAWLFGVRPQTIASWTRRGYLTAVKTPGGAHRYLRGEVAVLLTATKRLPSATPSQPAPLATQPQTQRLDIDQNSAQIVDRYIAGNSIRQLATEFGCSYGKIHQLLRSHGVTLRPRGGSRRTVPKGTQK